MANKNINSSSSSSNTSFSSRIALGGGDGNFSSPLLVKDGTTTKTIVTNTHTNNSNVNPTVTGKLPMNSRAFTGQDDLYFSDDGDIHVDDDDDFGARMVDWVVGPNSSHSSRSNNNHRSSMDSLNHPKLLVSDDDDDLERMVKISELRGFGSNNNPSQHVSGSLFEHHRLLSQIQQPQPHQSLHGSINISKPTQQPPQNAPFGVLASSSGSFGSSSTNSAWKAGMNNSTMALSPQTNLPMSFARAVSGTKGNEANQSIMVSSSVPPKPGFSSNNTQNQEAAMDLVPPLSHSRSQQFQPASPYLQQPSLGSQQRSRAASTSSSNAPFAFDFDIDDLPFEFSDFDTALPPQVSQSWQHRPPSADAAAAMAAAAAVTAQHQAARRASALSAGIASVHNRNAFHRDPLASPNRSTNIPGNTPSISIRGVSEHDEGTPTPYSINLLSSSASRLAVPDLSLPGSFQNDVGLANFRRGIGNAPLPSPVGIPIPTSSGSSPIAIHERESSSNRIGGGNSAYGLSVSQNAAASWNSNASAFAGPSSVSSDEGAGFLSSSFGATWGGAHSSGHSNNGGRFAASSVPASSGMMSGSVPSSFPRKASHGSFRQLPPGRANNALATATSMLGDDGCPILQVPRKAFWPFDGTMKVPNRMWKRGGTEKADNRHFMVMSYNVLAPLYCTENRYHECDPRYLDWEHRRKKILDEIAFHAPDFVCLQELPPSDFKEFFLPELQKIGYDGHFQQKKKTHAADGSAIFFLEARFSLLAVQAFAYNDQIPQDPSTNLCQRLAPFPNIALVCVFQNRQARSLRVRVVNTHLHWDPAFADTKLLQAAILMEWLERTHRDVPTVIAADLNSRPGDAVVDFLVRGKVAPGALFGDRDFGRFSASLQMSTRAVQPSSSLGTSPSSSQPVVPVALLRHGTKLASAYDRKDLPFTNKTSDFEGCIDHILYTSGTLSIRDVLGDFDNHLFDKDKEKNKPLESEEEKSVADDLDTPKAGEKSEFPGSSSLNLDLEGDDGKLLDDEDDGSIEDDASPPPMEPEAPAPPTFIVSPSDAITFVGGQLALPVSLSKPAGPAPPLPQGYLAKIKSLPTEHVPSDHLPLCAWLKWKTVPVGTGPVSGSSGQGERTRSRGGRRGNGGYAGGNNNIQSGVVQPNSASNILSVSAPTRPGGITTLLNISGSFGKPS